MPSVEHYRSHGERLSCISKVPSAELWNSKQTLLLALMHAHSQGSSVQQAFLAGRHDPQTYALLPQDINMEV